MSQTPDAEGLTEKSRLRIEYLEKMAQWHLFCFDLLSSLGELQHGASLRKDPAEILAITRQHLHRLFRFDIMAFLTVEEGTSDFILADCEPEDMRARMQKEVDGQIENGSFAWAINQNHPVVIPSREFGAPAILHVLATKSRTRGMFLGIAGKDSRSVDETVLYPLSIILQNTANALESSALYQWVSEQNATLEETVRRRTQALEDQTTLLRDEISQRKVAEEALLVAKDEAEAADMAKSEFLANMSHEIRTPLNAILGYTEILIYDNKEIGAPGLLDDLKSIDAAGKHLLGLLNDVLDLAKAQSGMMRLETETVDIWHVVDSVTSVVRHLADKNKNSLKIDCDESIGTMHADANRLRQILFNLLGNACKFTADGNIALSVKRTVAAGREWIYFAVADTGIGIQPEYLTRIFQEFSQADASMSRKYGGTGLGLAISQRLSRLMGGEIEVRSDPGKGSVFTLRLPADSGVAPMPFWGGQAHAEAKPAPRPAAVSRPTAPVLTSVPPRPAAVKPADRILVVDDDPVVCDLVKRFLSKEGFVVEMANNGKDGLKRAGESPPSLIILDIMMPGMDGWAVLAALKNHPVLKQVPVLMLSLLNEKERALASGAADYLGKPLNWTLFVEMVKKHRHIAGVAAGAPPILLIEEDLANRDVLRRILTKEGWPVLVADKGAAAIECAGKESPALILLGLLAHETGGLDMVMEFRRSESCRATPIIVLAAKELSGEDRLLLDEEVNGVLLKGNYTREDLVGEIKKCLQRSAAHGR